MERKFNCKNEELPVIASYVSSNLKRDLPDFSAYSPLFNQAYVDDYDAKIVAAEELVNPKLETQERSQITEKMYARMDDLIQPADRIEGYLQLGKKEINMSAKNFGTITLKAKVRSRDAEGVLTSLQLVSANIEKHKAALTACGLRESITNFLTESVPLIREYNQQQYEILINRKQIVEQNMWQLNDLYDQIMEICTIGKILYGKTDKVKADGYVFSNLIKSVRNTAKKNKEKPE